MRAMHRIARLERHDATPAIGLEPCAQTARGIAQFAEIVMCRRLDAAHAPPQINRPGAIQQGGDTGMCTIGGAKNLLRLVFQIRTINILHLEHGQRHALQIAQGHFATREQ